MKTEIIKLRINKNLKQRAVEKALLNDESISEYVRRLILLDLEKEQDIDVKSDILLDSKPYKIC